MNFPKQNPRFAESVITEHFFFYPASSEMTIMLCMVMHSVYMHTPSVVSMGAPQTYVHDKKILPFAIGCKFKKDTLLCHWLQVQ